MRKNWTANLPKSPMMNTIPPDQPSPVFADQFPILGSGMNCSSMLPTSPNYDQGDDNRFCPSDQRLISHYLIHKMFGNEDQVVRIPEVDILNHEPWELLPTAGEQHYQEAYYFYRRRSYFTSKDRYKRTTGGGYWKPTGKHREIRSGGNGEVIGSKRSLVFHYGRPAGQGTGTGYTIHEYSVGNGMQQPLREDLVLCKVMQKVPNHNNKTKTTARKMPSNKKKKKAAITPNENITTSTTLPWQEGEEDEVGSYLVASDFGNQNEAFQEAFSYDHHGGRMELQQFPEMILDDGNYDHRPLPDLDSGFDIDIDFDFES